MKTNKTVLVLFAVVCLMTLCSSQSYAAAAWHVCTIQEVGPSGANEANPYCYITLSSLDWEDNIVCVLPLTRTKDYLATALTAIAAGKQVKAWMNPDAPTPTVNKLFVIN